MSVSILCVNIRLLFPRNVPGLPTHEQLTPHSNSHGLLLSNLIYSFFRYVQVFTKLNLLVFQIRTGFYKSHQCTVSKMYTDMVF